MTSSSVANLSVSADELRGQSTKYAERRFRAARRFSTVGLLGGVGIVLSGVGIGLVVRSTDGVIALCTMVLVGGAISIGASRTRSAIPESASRIIVTDFDLQITTLRGRTIVVPWGGNPETIEIDDWRGIPDYRRLSAYRGIDYVVSLRRARIQSPVSEATVAAILEAARHQEVPISASPSKRPTNPDISRTEIRL
jgi:hypothetical protein